MDRSKADVPGRLGLLVDRYYWLEESRQQTARRDGQILAATLAGTALFLAGPLLGIDIESRAWFGFAVVFFAAAYVIATLGRRLRTLDCVARAERELEAAGHAVLGGVVHDRRGHVVGRPSGVTLAFEVRNVRTA